MTFPGLVPIVIESVSLSEIMADKLIAIAYRRYLGGRDLFDLWFHWLRRENSEERARDIIPMVRKKLSDRSLKVEDWQARVGKRLRTADLNRARIEWKRYLPPDFNRPLVWEEITQKAQDLLKFILL